MAADANRGYGSAREAVRTLAIEHLRRSRTGVHYTDLKNLIHKKYPKMNRNTVTGALYAFTQDPPPEVVKVSRGVYRHSSTPEPPAPSLDGSTGRHRESAFYKPFADWLVSEVEECTRAIPLGGSVFKDKWGTPDVIGVLEPRKSDIVQFPTEIVSAEVKADGTQLITAFGQACAYRLFSHKSYLVVPTASLEADVARLDVLSRLFGIGLILFDTESSDDPRFTIRVRASKHEPDGFYANRYLKEVEKQLFG